MSAYDDRAWVTAVAEQVETLGRAYALQLVVSLAAIVGGAELFVNAIESIAESLGVAPLVLALVVAPLATELPGKANSILWGRDGKDTLAVGNVTGAMAFQATIPVALGLAVTDWNLAAEAIVAGLIALAGGALALYALPSRRVGAPAALAWGALFAGFVVYAAAG